MSEGQNQEISCVNDDIVFKINDAEKLRVTATGFYVNGNPVDVGDQQTHDQTVYQALKSWLFDAYGE